MNRTILHTAFFVMLVGGSTSQATIRTVALSGTPAPGTAEGVNYADLNFACTACLSSPLLIDQQNTGQINASWSITLVGPIGQEFTPLGAFLDYVEFHVANSPNSGKPWPADLFVNIRSRSISGPILGTSASITIPVGFDGPAHFDFAAPVKLVPNRLFVMEMVEVPGGGNAAIGGAFNTYPGGRAILAGQAATYEDLWFREGCLYTVPEPATIVLALLCTLGFVGFARRCRHDEAKMSK